jgi:hypothetical protein
LLAKDANLARTAARYKIDTAKVTAAIRTGLSKTIKGSNPQKQQPKAATRTNQK